MNPADGRDPGLQPERTCLAWRRTLLASAGTLLLCLRAFVTESAPVWLGVVGIVTVTFCAVGACSIVRTRRYRQDPRDPRSIPGLGPAVISVTLAIAAGTCITQLL